MQTKLPSLHALRVFEAAARLQHFSRAAATLNLTQGAVSYQIRSLEEDLGFALFHRIGRSVQLTEQGKALFPIVESSFSQIGETIAQLRRDAKRQTREVTIATTTYVASHWLLKRLSRFMMAHPEIAVRLIPAGDADTVSLEIRWGEATLSGLDAELLFMADVMPVCAPTLLSGRSVPLQLSDLLHIPYLHDAVTREAFRRWQIKAGLAVPSFVAAIEIADPNVRMQAALDGQGLVLADWLLKDELEAGRLLAPFSTVLAGYGYHLVFHSRPDPSGPIAVFSQWLMEEAKQSRG